MWAFVNFDWKIVLHLFWCKSYLGCNCYKPENKIIKADHHSKEKAPAEKLTTGIIVHDVKKPMGV